MKIKTQDLTGQALDLAVARAWYGYDYQLPLPFFNPSVEWNQGGPIIELQGILFTGTGDGEMYKAWIVGTNAYFVTGLGPTHLIAAMRCYVASKLGDEVEIPEELK